MSNFSYPLLIHREGGISMRDTGTSNLEEWISDLDKGVPMSTENKDKERIIIVPIIERYQDVWETVAYIMYWINIDKLPVKVIRDKDHILLKQEIDTLELDTNVFYSTDTCIEKEESIIFEYDNLTLDIVKNNLSLATKRHIYEDINSYNSLKIPLYIIKDEMECRLHNQIVLRPDSKSLVEDILILGGWKKNRNVDITKIVKIYLDKGITVWKELEDFFHEFYTILSSYDFRFTIDDCWYHGGYDFTFDTMSILDIIDRMEEGYEEYEVVKQKAQTEITPIAEVGFQLGGTLWIDKNGWFYITHDYTDKVKAYSSVMEYLEDAWKFKEAKELFVVVK